MEAIRKQATKLREQVAKQQQAVLKQFAGGLGGLDNLVNDDEEHTQHQKLEELYISTRAAKHFQRDVVRGVEGYIVTGTKRVSIGTKLSEGSRKYGAENTYTSGNALSKAAFSYSRARAQIEKEHENLLKALGTQVAEPLKAMVMGSSLEDARHLAHQYDRVRQEAEAQAVEVFRWQSKLKESNANPEDIAKLEAAETKLDELKSKMATLGKEAAAAMGAVEGQQQQLTIQRLIAMVEAERAYHQRILQILDELEGEMLFERQSVEASAISAVDLSTPPPLLHGGADDRFVPQSHQESINGTGYFFGEVVHPYQADSDVELTLSIGDYVVVRKVSNNGWAEGECKGKAGWFPVGYVERRERVLASKVAEVF